jgi:hypothetical protein
MIWHASVQSVQHLVISNEKRSRIEEMDNAVGEDVGKDLVPFPKYFPLLVRLMYMFN